MKRMLAALLLLLSPLLAREVAALSPSQAITLALADLDRQAVEDAPFLRYLYLPGDEADAATFEPALRLHVNLISREARLAYPKRVAVGLWRVDKRNYGFGWIKAFENLANIDPYFHRRVTKVIVEEVEAEKVVRQPFGYYDGHGQFITTYYQDVVKIVKERRERKVVRNDLYAPLVAGQLASLALLTRSNAPIVRADWFQTQSCRQTDIHNRDNTGTGYFDFLGLKSRDDFFRLIGFVQRAVNHVGNEYRAVVDPSGVSGQNRQIEFDGAETGPHVKTLEVFDEAGRGVAIANLRKGEFAFVAEEHYGHLPNGLFVVYLSNDKGVQQSTVPDKIAGNRSELNKSNDLRVHPVLSCVQCHTNVLQPFEDNVRVVYTGRLGVLTNDKNVDLELGRAFGQNILRAFNRDRQEHHDALFAATGGKTAPESSAFYSAAFTRYAVNRLDLATAARELGATEAGFRKALENAALRLGRSDFRLDPFLMDTPVRTISRLDFEDVFQDAQDLLFGVLKE